MLNEELELMVQPADILHWREDKWGNIDVLVQWEKFLSCKNSWEYAALLLSSFLHFPLKDK
ncbi:hypothetical protein A2U01_0094978, partial [Trifolium medium]|nr:hypothetical protein [Trifolium medium]